MTTVNPPDLASTSGTQLAALVEKYFYIAMACAICGIVVYGFSQTIDGSLIHPASPPPWILYLHAVVFSLWLVVLLVQTTLVRAGNVRLHRTLGYGGLALGASMPVIAIATKLTLLRAAVAPSSPELAFVAVTLNDMLCFSVTFALAIRWRRRVAFHRRLMFIAAACLTVAAFARFPPTLVVAPWWYAYVDTLIGLGALIDIYTQRRLHPVYALGLPMLVLSQAVAMCLYLQSPAWWLHTVSHLLA